MNLQIIGPMKRRKKYDRIPMHDGLGAVTAYLYWNRVSYRPKGGTKETRYARAQLIAAATGGTVLTRDAWLPTENYIVVVDF
jgi:hypothetical protein